MNPKKDEYMRGYADGFKDAKNLRGDWHGARESYPEARFETASLHQDMGSHVGGLNTLTNHRQLTDKD